LELVLPENQEIDTVDKFGLLPVIEFSDADDVKAYCERIHISYKKYDGKESSKDILNRLIEVGTHKGHLVERVAMQEQGLNRIEIYHNDPRFSIILALSQDGSGKKFKRYYKECKKLEWIGSGGGSGADADEDM
jgi:hypothetical protein